MRITKDKARKEFQRIKTNVSQQFQNSILQNFIKELIDSLPDEHLKRSIGMTKDKIQARQHEIFVHIHSVHDRMEAYFDLIDDIAYSLPDEPPERWVIVRDAGDGTKSCYRLLDMKEKLTCKINDCWYGAKEETEAEIARLKGKEDKPRYEKVIDDDGEICIWDNEKQSYPITYVDENISDTVLDALNQKAQEDVKKK